MAGKFGWPEITANGGFRWRENASTGNGLCNLQSPLPVDAFSGSEKLLSVADIGT